MSEELYLDSQQNSKFTKFLTWIKKDQKKKLKAGTKNKRVLRINITTKKVCVRCQIGEPIPNDDACSKCLSTKP